MRKLSEESGIVAVNLEFVAVAEVDLRQPPRWEYIGPQKLACCAGFTPSHHESDAHVDRGRITKQGSGLVRWAVAESVQSLPKTSTVGAVRDRIGLRRDRNIGVVAAAA